MMERDSCGKALVFSQFTSMLALIQHRLEQVCACMFRGGGRYDVNIFHTDHLAAAPSNAEWHPA